MAPAHASVRLHPKNRTSTLRHALTMLRCCTCQVLAVTVLPGWTGVKNALHGLGEDLRARA
jgi:hypothetical protein